MGLKFLAGDVVVELLKRYFARCGILLEAHRAGIAEDNVRRLSYEHVTLCAHVLRLAAGGDALRGASGQHAGVRRHILILSGHAYVEGCLGAIGLNES